MSAGNGMAGTASPTFTSAVQGQAATLLVQLYNYLQANTQRSPALGNAIPVAFDAVELYGRGLYPQALAQTLMIYQWIESQGGALPAPRIT
jgi:hypothetical protein